MAMVSAVKVELFQSGRRVASEWCCRCDGFEVPSYHGCTKWALASTKIGEIRSASSNIECNGDPFVPPYHKVFLAIGSTYSFVVVDNNNDNLTWSFADGAMMYMSMHTSKNADDGSSLHIAFLRVLCRRERRQVLGLRRQKRKQWRRIWLHEPLLCW